MRRLWIPLVLLTLACRAVIPDRPTPMPTVTPGRVETFQQPTLTPFLPSTETATVTVTPEPTFSIPTPAVTPTPTGSPFQVRFHPDGPLYVGDQVSLEVVAPPDGDYKEKKLEVRYGDEEGRLLGEAIFQPFGLSQRIQSTLWWVWDTMSLPAGKHQIYFKVLPDGEDWTEAVELLPADQMPMPGAHWSSAESECCVIHYITGTLAERDLARLVVMVDEQARKAGQRLGVTLKERVNITFFPRLLGHGGFTNHEIFISYLDRHYTATDPSIIIHHELVHRLDAQAGGDFRPTMLVEGLAVYLSGGHFKLEPLMSRAAALLAPAPGCVETPAVKGSDPTPGPGSRPGCGLDVYYPLTQLADNFYPSQHEIGYLEAGALVEFMIKTWGWDAYNAFYRDIHKVPAPVGQPREGYEQSQALDKALQNHFHLSLDELDSRFQEALRQENLTPTMAEDVRLTIDYYDTVRRYQQYLDPSAYFLTAWLPDGQKMREKGIVADLSRAPSGAENSAIETLLVAANSALVQGDYARTSSLLDAVNATLKMYAPHSDGPTTLAGSFQLLSSESLMLTSDGRFNLAAISTALIMPTGTGQAVCAQYFGASSSVCGPALRKVASW